MLVSSVRFSVSPAARDPTPNFTRFLYYNVTQRQHLFVCHDTFPEKKMSECSGSRARIVGGSLLNQRKHWAGAMEVSERVQGRVSEGADRLIRVHDEGSNAWDQVDKHDSEAALPECLVSASGSSFGSLETLGVAHPTKNKTEKARSGRMRVCLTPFGQESPLSCGRRVWRLTWRGRRRRALRRAVLCPQRVHAVLPLQVQLPRLLLALLACRGCTRRHFRSDFEGHHL